MIKIKSNILYKLILHISFTFITCSCYSQDTLKAEKAFEDYMNVLASERFNFEKPDRDFEFLEDSTGYQCLQKSATIKYTLLPGSYNELVKEIKKLRSTKETLVIDTLTFNIQKRQTFILIQEEIAPAGSGYENYILTCTIVPFNDNITLGIIGSYPKSYDKILRQKFINAALTIRKK